MSEAMTREMKESIQATFKRALTTLEEKVKPSHAALVVVDVQNDFCAQGGYVDREGWDLTSIQAMVPRLVNFIDQARNAGLTIVYIQSIYNTVDNRYLSEVWLEQMQRIGKGRFIEYPVCALDSWGANFYDGIKPLPGEIVVNKHRYGAFEGTDLDLVLRSKGIKTLIMTGVATNVCVETTARTGFLMDYYIVFLKDCTATLSEEMHNSTLRTIELSFGQVMDSSEVIKCWGL